MDYEPATAPEYLCPEAHFERRIGPPADVCGLACTIFQTRSGSPLFETFLGGEDDALKEIVATPGKLPDLWWGAFKNRHKWFDEDGNPKPGRVKKTSIKQKLVDIGLRDGLPATGDDGPMMERPGTKLRFSC